MYRAAVLASGVRHFQFGLFFVRFPRVLEREQLRPRLLRADALHARWQAGCVPVPQEGDPAPHPVRALRSLQLAEEQVGRVEGGEVPFWGVFQGCFCIGDCLLCTALARELSILWFRTDRFQICGFVTFPGCVRRSTTAAWRCLASWLSWLSPRCRAPSLRLAAWASRRTPARSPRDGCSQAPVHFLRRPEKYIQFALESLNPVR